jgi:hypothetical protein
MPPATEAPQPQTVDPALKKTPEKTSGPPTCGRSEMGRGGSWSRDPLILSPKDYERFRLFLNQPENADLRAIYGVLEPLPKPAIPAEPIFK